MEVIKLRVINPLTNVTYSYTPLHIRFPFSVCRVLTVSSMVFVRSSENKSPLIMY